MPTLLSLNVGRPKDVPWQDRTVHTGIWKSPVTGTRLVRRLNVDGDGQGDLNGHGGEQRAVLVYQRESYDHWQRHFGRDQLEYGAFGENFTVDGLPDDEVCIGDRYRVGDAEFEVTQPRVTCFRVGMRLGEPQLPALLVAHRRPGFYLRVVREGHLRAGDQISLVRRGRHRVTVAEIDGLLYLPDRDIRRLRAAVDIPALSPGWQQSLRELLGTAENGTTITAPAVGVEPGWAGFRDLRVARVVRESETVLSVYLADPGGRPLPVPQPGQFLTVRVPVVEGGPAAVRSYSLSAAPAPDTYRISVKREEFGAVSRYVHSALTTGSLVDVAAPRGEFVLTDDDRPVVLISAGIGATPVLAMLHRLAAERSGRQIWWLHATRDADQHAFAAEVHDLLSGLVDSRERIFYSRPTAPVRDPDVAIGRLDAAVLAATGLPADAVAYVCGPVSFMDDVRAALAGIGITPDRVHTETFGALAAINPGIVAAAAVAPHRPPIEGRGPQITFARSGLSVSTADEYGSILELAEACDVPTRWSCRTGVCHTCATPVLTGRVHYRPEPLEAPRPGETLICCAQPDSDLVLDL